MMRLCAWAGFAALSVSIAAPAQLPDPKISLTACRLEHPARVLALPAECGTLSVAEDPQRPQGRKIDLFVARVPAINLRKAADPLFLIAGGPGTSTADLYTASAAAFDRIRRDRDIVLVDQRGTGRSNRLDCDFGDVDLLDIKDDVDVVAITRRCRDDLAERADVRQYTTSIAVRDLDAVRRALGYERVNLYGVSYGTRVAQHFARRYPEATRALILDGVVDPKTILGPDIAIDAERALERILQRCIDNSECAKAFPDPLADYRALRANLATRTVAVAVPDSVTGRRTFDFTNRHLSAVLRLATYNDDQAALLPLAISFAHRQGDYTALANQFRVFARSMEKAFAYGMHNSVACSEDAALINPSRVDTVALADTHMGSQQVEQLVEMCREWPLGPVDEDLHAPLDSAAAALLLSGSDDPVTPPQYAEKALRAFADGKHVVVAGHGHGQVTAPCVDRVMAAFISAGTTKGLDVSCTEKLRPMPFFTTLAGPPP